MMGRRPALKISFKKYSEASVSLFSWRAPSGPLQPSHFTSSVKSLPLSRRRSSTAIQEVNQPSSSSLMRNECPRERLEVCHGPDCFGSGGGAAMLEIEELVQEHADQANLELVAGGCRNFCSMGPNVHFGTNHFTKVNNVRECRAVVENIAPNDDGKEPQGATMATRMMAQRAERRRWEFLREVARVKKKKGGASRIEELRRQLQEVISSEMNVARDDPSLVGRCQRRKERFGTMLEAMSHRCVEDSSDSSFSSDDDESCSDSHASQDK